MSDAPIIPPVEETPAGQYYDNWGLADESKGYIQTKGFRDAESIIKSYRELEKTMGVDKNEIIRIPKTTDGTDPDYTEIFAKLGRPEKADGYGLPDNEFAKAASEKFHALGITAKQAKELTSWFDSYGEQAGSASQIQVQKMHDEQVAALKTEWGKDYDLNLEISKQAIADNAQAIGIDADTLNKIGDLIGAGKAAKLFYLLGQTTNTADKTIKDYNANTGKESYEQAVYKLDKMNSDPDFAKKVGGSNPDKDFINELNRLNAIKVQGNGATKLWNQ